MTIQPVWDSYLPFPSVIPSDSKGCLNCITVRSAYFIQMYATFSYTWAFLATKRGSPGVQVAVEQRNDDLW